MPQIRSAVNATTVDVGLPNESAVRMRYGYTLPDPVLMLTTLKSPRLSGSPFTPPVQPPAKVEPMTMDTGTSIEPRRERRLDRGDG